MPQPQSNADPLTEQLSKLNQKLESLDFAKSRFLIYNANPFKFALYNFLAGVFHSLGSLFGTVIVAALVIYFVSQIDLVSPITHWFQQIMTQMDWQKIIPTPQSVDINNIPLGDKVLQQIQRQVEMP